MTWPLFAVAVILTHSVYAGRPVAGKPSLTRPTTRTEKHFDFDEDGYLNPHERLVLRTHQTFHYALVRKKSQLPYDQNENRMLEPFEEAQYLADKRSGRIKEVYAKFKKDNKTAKRAGRRRLDYVEDLNEIYELRQ